MDFFFQEWEEMVIWHLLVSSLSEGAGEYCTESTASRPDPGLGAEPGHPQEWVFASPQARSFCVFVYPRIHCPFLMPVGFILLVFAHTFTCLSSGTA